MRRSSTLLAVVFGLLLSSVPGSLTVALADPAPLPEPAARASLSALDTAGRVLTGAGRADDPSATVALRDLWMARPDLTGSEAIEATALLARPTDGAADPYGSGYTVASASSCGTHICVHSVPTTADAPTDPNWVALTLTTMEAVYEREVNGLGFRAPRSDGTTGGDGRLDVYIKDLSPGLYGYCAAERRKTAHTASGFCVLDNDYAPAEFPDPAQTPESNLAVTAAHEFFHAVQYSYDYTEDRWMLESTATWMEEQVYDDVNDNRQYLSDSQMQTPYVPLDAFSSRYSFQYANWIFWQYLTDRFGTGLVKTAWKSAGSLRRDGGHYSIEAIKSVLRKKKKSFTDVYADFAADNITPSLTYAEAPGVPEYADPKVFSSSTLTRGNKSRTRRARLFHLSSAAMRVQPSADFSNKKWRLRVTVRGPALSSSPAARLVLLKTSGKVSVRKVRFNRRGLATTVVPFSSAKMANVTVSFANVSTRYRCGRRTIFACGGKSLDDRKKFTIVTTAFKPQRRH